MSCAAELGGHTRVSHVSVNPWPGPVYPLLQGQSWGHTRKQCIYCQNPAFTLFAQGSFSFLMNVLALPARLARGGLTHASGERAVVIHPTARLATRLCSQLLAFLGTLRGLVTACQAMKLERALSVTEAAQPPALCWRLAASTKCA